MKRTAKYFVLLLALTALGNQAFAWGFWAHKRINRLAVFTLPPDMLGLYKTNIDYLTEHAVDPDARRYAVDGEAPRHYIDIDHYGEYPFDMVPRKWDDAVEKFGEETLLEYGTVPWTIQSVYYRLVDAFKDKNLSRILKLSADIGHYIADSNVPLHTTENYNGQLTDQKGIHGLWESRIPEVFGNNWNYFVGPSYYLKSPLMEAWSSVMEAHVCLDSVLSFEKKLTEEYPSDIKYSYETRGASQMRVYSYDFVKAYHQMLSGQVERRIRTSVIRVGSFWYSAWVDAGQPDLSDLFEEKLEEEVPEYEHKIKIIDRESQDIGAIDWMSEFFGSCCHRGHDHEGHGHSYIEVLPNTETQSLPEVSWWGAAIAAVMGPGVAWLFGA